MAKMVITKTRPKQGLTIATHRYIVFNSLGRDVVYLDVPFITVDLARQHCSDATWIKDNKYQKWYRIMGK